MNAPSHDPDPKPEDAPSPKPEPVLDTVALRVMTFAHPAGVEIMLAALASQRARFPSEVYDRDEDAVPPGSDDHALSELARGLRYARRQAAILSADEARRYRRWLRHSAQIGASLAKGRLVIDPLTIPELPLREEYRDRFGIGRGEAACLVLARRLGSQVVFLSSDALACEAAASLGLAHLTLRDVLAAWVERSAPPIAEFDQLVDGMRTARFGLKHEFVEGLRQRLRP